MFKRLLALVVVCVALAVAVTAGTPLVITHVNVVDVMHGGIRREMTLVVLDGKISEIRHGRRTNKFPSGATLVDGSGKFVIPGLWDMNQHFMGEPGIREFNMLIANGVLGVRNMGGIAKEVIRAREQTASGQVLGPQILACEPIVVGANPSNPPISVSAHDPEKARLTVQSLKAMGADCAIIPNGVSLDTYLAIADEVKKVHLPLVGQVPLRVHPLQAANAGQRSIEHQIGLWGASSVEDEVLESDKTNDVFAEGRTRNVPQMLESIAKRGNYILDHFSDQRAHELYRAFVRKGTYLDPTLVANRARTFADEISKEDDLRLKYIPAILREWWNPKRDNFSQSLTPVYMAFQKRQFEKTLQQIPVAHRAGARFLAGTSTILPFIYPGFSVHDELGLFVQAGLTPLEALQTATINPARFLGLEQSFGTVQRGRLASLVLLDADPLKDIHNTTKISAVIVRGKLLSRSDLDGMLNAAVAAARR